MTFGPYTIESRVDIAGGGFDAAAVDADGKPVRLWVGAPGRTRAPDGTGPDALVATLSRVYHSSLPRVLAADTIDDRAVLVLQPYRGRTLADRLAAAAVDDPLEAIDWVRSVAAALVKAHRAGIPHGALDEEAVFLADDGRTLLLHVGFASFLDDRPATAAPHASGSVAAAPTATSADARDVFALSRILVRCLDAPSADSTSAAAQTGRSADSFPAHLPEGLRRLLARAIHPDPDLRLRHAEELTGDLAVIRASWGSPAEPTARRTVPVGLVTHPAAVVGVAIILLLALTWGLRAC